MGAMYVVCVLNVDLGAIFSDFCLSSAIYYMGQNINHLQLVSACLYICVCARTGLGADRPNISKTVEDRASVSMGQQ